jgi:hypothetical protein
VTINAIEVKQNDHVLEHATAELYAVVYPLAARNAGLVPQCNPCDHAGNGIDPGDFHDHVLDSIPADPGSGEFSPLWHVLAVRPNYTADPAHNAAVNEAYLSQLPLKSEAAVDAFVDAGYAEAGPLRSRRPALRDHHGCLSHRASESQGGPEGRRLEQQRGTVMVPLCAPDRPVEPHG